jgi:outer membrane murein-binding lipoprotein Lpp
MKRLSFVVVLTLLIAGCSSTGKRFDNLYVQAENEIKLAKQMGFLWRDTQAFLRQSKLAQEAGEKKLAMELMKEALDQARLAQQQARQQTDPDIFYPPN